MNLKSYIDGLGPEDAVIMEASTGTFYWADLVEAKGALCFVLDPYKFKIIKDSWNKTDKHNARNIGKALWIYMVTEEFGIPTVYRPDVFIREPRKLFSQYVLLNKQIRIMKRRRAERARIALIRKICGAMRRMLLNGEEYRVEF